MFVTHFFIVFTCPGTNVLAGVMNRSKNSTTSTDADRLSLLDMDVELAKITDTCLSDADYEQITGNYVKAFLAREPTLAEMQSASTPEACYDLRENRIASRRSYAGEYLFPHNVATVIEMEWCDHPFQQLYYINRRTIYSVTEIKSSSVFDTDDELTKIANTRLNDADYEQMTGNYLKAIIARSLSYMLIPECVAKIGHQEMLAALKFSPNNPWQKYNDTIPTETELQNASTPEAYYELKSLWRQRIDDQFLFERSVTTGESMLATYFLIFLIICICLGNVLADAERLSLLDMDVGLDKIEDTCLSNAEYEKMIGNQMKASVAGVFISTWFAESVAIIGFQEMRKILKFSPPHPWQSYNGTEPTLAEMQSASTPEAYYDLRENCISSRSTYVGEYLFYPRNQVIDKTTVDDMMNELDYTRLRVRKATDKVIHRTKWDD
ncbi:Protein CBG02808 [Caenorhabditis briggsae]|uniref:Protein CBG02808 n=1 Tax=Caenorhabditis briggsae TaxID=6238 RepID=A8WTG8_CAEBR|nr:Protein CBG02808 [Caenorhabditis briggsae]CAP23780.2 Protein CBG02808 [Caenorhabditis briggsae]